MAHRLAKAAGVTLPVELTSAITTVITFIVHQDYAINGSDTPAGSAKVLRRGDFWVL